MTENSNNSNSSEISDGARGAENRVGSLEELQDRVESGLRRMEMGADGYKDKLPPRLIAAIQEAPLVPEEMLGWPKRPTGILSTREREIVLYVSHGARQPKIAEDLGISVETVKTHLKRIKDKLGAKNTAHMVRLALESEQIE